MSKKYNQGAPRRRVIVAAQQEVKQRVRRAEFKGMKRGKKMGASMLSSSFNRLSLFQRVRIAFTGLDFGRG